MIAETLDMREVTLSEALERLKLGGDMDMMVKLPRGGSKVVMQVRDDWLTSCVFGPDQRLYSAKVLLRSEMAVLQALLTLLGNAADGKGQHVVL